MIHFKLRAAEPRDVGAIAGLIAELADFEQLSHLVRCTPETLAPVTCVVAEAAATVGGMP